MRRKDTMRTEEMMTAMLGATPRLRRRIEAVLLGNATVPTTSGVELRLVTISAAAKMLGISRCSIYRLVREK